ncbi:hypothetical protein WN944_021950 [Citrus x changshan-huyou]|uniref:Uncharacterized protein n=4 Tax=Citrus TaxID=2706 RepID=A0ACB8J909_CITSI|nr:uncharacterized protein DDB_G0271670 [Citrus x clementina]XP_006465705.1 protein OXIDATIVE STRESS 3 [Citrus sinensis]ESR40098.1 hypothetical protein CICLE_v10026542mg [Citrus x clementina]KAH9714050.1 hypothetical protein KPL71_020545 [Citrus sinensis]KDO51828.1 hypothetical protein CISIN_1g029278mg [Citrus sinensis]
MLLMETQAGHQKQLLMGQHGRYKHAKQLEKHSSWTIMEGHDQATSSSSSLEDSSATNGSSTSSSDLVDDASSTNSSSASSNSNNGPLFELSELMAQLPIKRGLSKYYQGKSQSFTSLSRAMSIEDLAKKETPYRKKMKSCRSYGGGLDIKATISKKNSSSRGSFSSLSCSSAGKRGSFVGSNHNSRLPPIPAQKHF